MIHYPCEDASHAELRGHPADPTHYAVGASRDGYVLVQLGDSNCDQIRVRLTQAQARHFIHRMTTSLSELDP